MILISIEKIESQFIYPVKNQNDLKPNSKFQFEIEF